MNTKEAIEFLNYLTKLGMPHFTFQEMTMFIRWKYKRDVSRDTLRKSVQRHLHTGLFLKLCKGRYVNGLNNPYKRNPFLRYRVANALRPNSINWESLESRLSQLGVISQVPNRLTFMTTGKSGVYDTLVGTFEFSHAPKNWKPDWRLLRETGILHATAEQAWKDLQHVGRNTGLVDMEALEDEIREEREHEPKYLEKLR